MTVNVIVATYHGVVLGCDSLSSMIDRAIFPFRKDAFARSPDGDIMRDHLGRPLLVLSDDALEYTATNVMGGVQKMFLLYEDPDSDVECSVAAITSGLGTLNGVVIAELAGRFRRKALTLCSDFSNAQAITSSFVDFLRPLWEQQVGFAGADPSTHAYLPELAFLVAGYGPDDEYIKVFRVSVKNRTVEEEFTDPPHCSAAWAGQSNTVASLVNGVSPQAQWSVTRATLDSLRTQRERIARSILDKLTSEGVAIPPHFEATVEENLPTSWPWHAGQPQIDWPNLPVQSAVDLVSTLVNAESAIQKFSMGIATVGGRTRIGLMCRGTKFAFLNEPQIVHHHVGYNHDA